MLTFWDTSMRDFVSRHLADPTDRLLLSAHRYPGIDMPAAVDQIEARRRIRLKLPEWYALPDLIMGGRVPAEQCSSEVTARFKQTLLPAGCRSLCDLTGGMGVDFWYMSRGLARAVYTERDARLCAIMRHNLAVLSTHSGSSVSYEVRVGDGRSLPLPDVDVLYLDPARRDGAGGRVYAIDQCEPNLIEWHAELLAHAPTVIAKLSPMADVTDMVRRLRGLTDVYVVGLRGECKEVLVVLRREAAAAGVVCHCVDFLPAAELRFDFVLPDPSARGGAPVPLAVDGLGAYLYEPDVTLMKAQAFAPLAERYGVAQLDADTHLFTSAHWVDDFPGRKFLIECQLPFSSATLRRLSRTFPQANVAVRNFPLSAEALRRRAGLRDGGEVYFFGAQVVGQGPVLLICRRPPASGV